MILQNKHIVNFNLPQLLIASAKQPKKIFEGGRGVGKSTIMAWETLQVVQQMPRCTAIIVGETYQQILTRTLPSTIAGWERLGYYKDLHYFVGRRAPKSWNWPEAYEPPVKYDHAIHWYTGTVFHLVSQDRKGDGRGINSSYVLGDECGLLNFESLNTDVLATNRAMRREFQKSQYLNGWLFASSTPLTEQGRWMFKFEEEARKNPTEYFYLRASALENKENLPERWFRDMQRSMPEWLYNAEILNERVTKIQGCFYGNLVPNRHYYNAFDYGYYDGLGFDLSIAKVTCLGDRDLNLNEPLTIGVDWGASINSMVICQHQGDEFHFLNNIYVKQPLILHNLIEAFINYYGPHRNKTVYFHYDRNGNSKKDNSPFTNYEQAAKMLRDAGWNVIQMYRGLDPSHQSKHTLWAMLLREENVALPKMRFNKNNCRELIISMENAKVLDYKGIHKDKRGERNENLPQEEATHLSDAADIPVFTLFSHYLEGAYNYGGGSAII